MKINILGIKIDNISFSDAIKTSEDALLQKKQIKIFTPNPEIILEANRNEKFKNILTSGDLLIPDGIGLVFLSGLKEKISGVDLMLEICRVAEKYKKSVFFLGGYNDAAKKTADILKQKFPELVVAGFSEDVDVCYNFIESKQPDIIFVALGAPKQEFWISENIKNFPSVNIAMGVGGAFDMMSGSIKRAPKVFQEIHMEWFWRFLTEPRKRFKRIINAVLVFPMAVFKFKLKNLNIKSNSKSK